MSSVYLDGVRCERSHAQVVLVVEEEVLVPQPDHPGVLGLDGPGEGREGAGPSGNKSCVEGTGYPAVN